MFHDDPGFKPRSPPHQVRPIFALSPVAIRILEVKVHPVSKLRQVMKPHLVQGYRYDRRLEWIGSGPIHFRTRDSSDITLGNRLTHDEQVCQASVERITDPLIRDDHAACPV